MHIYTHILPKWHQGQNASQGVFMLKGKSLYNQIWFLTVTLFKKIKGTDLERARKFWVSVFYPGGLGWVHNVWLEAAAGKSHMSESAT